MNGRKAEFVAFGAYRFSPSEGLWRDTVPVPLPPRGIALLTALLARPGTVVSKQDLLDAVWPGTFVTESSLLEAIGLVRDALGDDRRNPQFIQTVHRRGYRFIARVDNLEPLEPLAPGTEPLEPLESWEPLAPSDTSDPLRPILLACATYAITTVLVGIVFAVFGQRPVDRRVVAMPSAAPRLAVSHSWPSWTPEGIEIAFAFSKAGPFNVAGAWDQFPTSVSPDGRLLVFAEAHPMSGTDIWLLDLNTGARRALVRTWFDETFARFSPDGHSIAYMSNVSGSWEIYVQSLSGSATLRVSSGGGMWPSWSTAGNTLYFTTGDDTMAAAIGAAPTLTAAAPVIAHQHGGRAHGRADLRVVLDWFSELARVRPS